MTKKSGMLFYLRWWKLVDISVVYTEHLHFGYVMDSKGLSLSYKMTKYHWTFLKCTECTLSWWKGFFPKNSNVGFMPGEISHTSRSEKWTELLPEQQILGLH